MSMFMKPCQRHFSGFGHRQVPCTELAARKKIDGPCLMKLRLGNSYCENSGRLAPSIVIAHSTPLGADSPRDFSTEKVKFHAFLLIINHSARCVHLREILLHLAPVLNSSPRRSGLVSCESSHAPWIHLNKSQYLNITTMICGMMLKCWSRRAAPFRLSRSDVHCLAPGRDLLRDLRELWRKDHAPFTGRYLRHCPGFIFFQLLDSRKEFAGLQRGRRCPRVTESVTLNPNINNPRVDVFPMFRDLCRRRDLLVAPAQLDLLLCQLVLHRTLWRSSRVLGHRNLHSRRHDRCFLPVAGVLRRFVHWQLRSNQLRTN